MTALLIVSIITSSGVKQTLTVPTTSKEVCMTAGELISRDLAYKVQEVSFECDL